MKVDETNFDILDRVSKMTLTDYEIKWFDKKNIDGYIPAENLLSMIEDLLCEIDRLEEEIEDIKQDLEDNYRPIPYEEQIGFSITDFIDKKDVIG